MCSGPVLFVKLIAFQLHKVVCKFEVLGSKWDPNSWQADKHHTYSAISHCCPGKFVLVTSYSQPCQLLGPKAKAQTSALRVQALGVKTIIITQKGMNHCRIWFRSYSRSVAAFQTWCIYSEFTVINWSSAIAQRRRFWRAYNSETMLPFVKFYFVAEKLVDKLWHFLKRIFDQLKNMITFWAAFWAPLR